MLRDNVLTESEITLTIPLHDDVIKWKHFPRYWPFVRGIHRSPGNSPHKGQWRGALMFSLICALNKRLNKQSWGWWFETSSRSLWRHRNKNVRRNDRIYSTFFIYSGNSDGYLRYLIGIHRKKSNLTALTATDWLKMVDKLINCSPPEWSLPTESCQNDHKKDTLELVEKMQPVTKMTFPLQWCFICSLNATMLWVWYVLALIRNISLSDEFLWTHMIRSWTFINI